MASSPSTIDRPVRNAIVTIAALWAVYLASALPLILVRYDRGRGAYDQEHFHLPAIRQFIRELPHPDLHDYPSATTPGYHLIIASIAKAVGTEDERVLRLLGGIFTLGLLATVGIVAARVGAVTGIIISLPIVMSLYVFDAGVWILPDNAGWWTLMLAMLLALRKRIDVWTFVGSAILIFAVAMMRQVNIWIVAPMLVSVWLRDSLFSVRGGEGGVRSEIAEDVPLTSAPLPRLRRRGNSAAIMLLAVTPAAVALLYLFHLWHGLIPPNQRQFIGGGNLAAFPGVLSDIGALGIFYFPFLLRLEKPASTAWRFALGALLGAAISLIPPTTHDQPAGRYSGLWNITSHIPILMGRSSLLIVAMSALGGGILLAWLWRFPFRERFIWGSAAIAFIIAQAANHNAFYRYYEPVILIAAVITVSRLGSKTPRWALAGPLLLAVLLAAVTVLSLVKASAV